MRQPEGMPGHRAGEVSGSIHEGVWRFALVDGVLHLWAPDGTEATPQTRDALSTASRIAILHRGWLAASIEGAPRALLIKLDEDVAETMRVWVVGRDGACLRALLRRGATADALLGALLLAMWLTRGLGVWAIAIAIAYLSAAALQAVWPNRTTLLGAAAADAFAAASLAYGVYLGNSYWFAVVTIYFAWKAAADLRRYSFFREA